MTLEARKINIISWISQLHDKKMVARLEELQLQQDWWLTISDDERAEIEEGIRQADNGEVKSTEEVFEKYQKWL
jgi:predicted transcriptional regulator